MMLNGLVDLFADFPESLCNSFNILVNSWLWSKLTFYSNADALNVFLIQTHEMLRCYNVKIIIECCSIFGILNHLLRLRAAGVSTL